MHLEKWAGADLFTGGHNYEQSLALRVAPPSCSPPPPMTLAGVGSSPVRWTLADGNFASHPAPQVLSVKVVYLAFPICLSIPHTPPLLYSLNLPRQHLIPHTHPSWLRDSPLQVQSVRLLSPKPTDEP